MVELDISANALFGPGLKVVAEALSGSQAMTGLNISSNSIAQRYNHNGFHYNDMVGIEAITNAIPTMRALAMLDASENNMFGKEDTAGITAWAAALRANSSLKQLNLAKTNISVNDAKIIGPAIRANEALAALDLRGNEFDDEDMTTYYELCGVCEASGIKLEV